VPDKTAARDVPRGRHVIPGLTRGLVL